MEKAENLGQQVQDQLFGRKKPRILDADSAELAALMGRLTAWARRLARLAGDSEEDYRLVLAEGTIASIDAQCTIYVGRSFLLEHAHRPALLVGVIAHEVGHRPKRWEQYRAERPTNREELHELCRLEETYADFFSGRALAELGMTPDDLCAFLTELEAQDGERPHPDYFPAKLRAEVIRDGFSDGQRQSSVRKKMFPALAKRLDPKNDLGSG